MSTTSVSYAVIGFLALGLSAVPANAESVRLSEAQLDRVTAGYACASGAVCGQSSCSSSGSCNSGSSMGDGEVIDEPRLESSKTYEVSRVFEYNGRSYAFFFTRPIVPLPN